MWDFLADYLAVAMGDLIDLLPKPLRIGCWTILGAAVAALLLWLLLR
ncbi:MAG TPA: hypothetical protein VFL92_03120 [Sphingomonas sp.]|nr:hypothetical protein [Sphingomonas sp.]